MPTFLPEVDVVAEFREISNDFTNPREIVREAISNSFDAGASEITIDAYIDKSSGEDELVITIGDNGHGMGIDGLKAFYGLGYSTRRLKDQKGFKASDSIGEKGHGTKIYFNSNRIEVSTICDGEKIDAYLDAPVKSLRAGQIPDVHYEVSKVGKDKQGTMVKVIGYNRNIQEGFGHRALKDYILWFTKFGSIEGEFNIHKHKDAVLRLSGLGWKEARPETIRFGHPFPKENTHISTLRSIDRVTPMEHYVARWDFGNEEVIGMPGVRIDFVFYIEGDQAKRKYNPMIHEKYATYREGEYNVQDRYGLWLCKDHFPITRRNSWVSEKSEWTKYHAFVNCQEFRLTANRGDLENTPPEIMSAVQDTVEDIFKNRIANSDKFKKYSDELEKQHQYKNEDKETEDYIRRMKSALAKKYAELDGNFLLEPRQEGGVFSLFLQVKTIRPDLFDFKVVDYDTSIGYDLLVTKDTALDLTQASLKFVEMKYRLERNFNHSFKRLAAIICWDTKLRNEDKISDMTGEQRTMRITPRSKDVEGSYKKFMLVSDTEEHNIEVYVLNEYLEERLGIKFQQVAAEHD